ncbi:hypothetical protein OG271_06705 [Micromonospora rifamycinica]|uniref:hypothetical protein n=1 Tax=Micromonospora rifamycinica TaxID=291594 RepID=UPI002E2DF7F7|nr:hypothetical protein [Micromonospora rifamycinica]
MVIRDADDGDAVRLWRSLGFRVLATVPEAFDHAEHGPVGLHVMFLDLRVPR